MYYAFFAAFYISLFATLAAQNIKSQKHKNISHSQSQ